MQRSGRFEITIDGKTTVVEPGDCVVIPSGAVHSGRTLTDCEIAVLGAEAMDEMMTVRPVLAASLIALLARKMSLRLRAVGARLSDRR